MDLLAMPEIWVGCGLFGGLLYIAFGHRSSNKQQQARLARATRSTKLQAAYAQQSLKRKDPTGDSLFAQRIAGFSIITKLRGRLEMAGIAMTPHGLLKRIAGIFVAVVFALAGVLGKTVLIALLVGALIALGAPHLLIRRKIRKRQMQFLKLFPEAIDLIVRGLRAGLPVGESFTTVSREIPEPVGNIFATITQQTQLGLPLEKSLVDAAGKIDLTEFNFFVTTIILQRETGGNLGEILSNLSDMLRQRQMMKLKIFALSSEARASAMIVGALPIVVFALLSIVSPEYLAPFYDDYRGNLAMLGAIGTIGVGSFIMYRMSQLEI